MGLFEQQEFHSAVSQSRTLFIVRFLRNPLESCLYRCRIERRHGKTRRKFQLIRARWSPLERVISRDESGSFVSVLERYSNLLPFSPTLLPRRAALNSPGHRVLLHISETNPQPRDGDRRIHLWKYCESCKVSIARARPAECTWSKYATKGEHDEHTCLGHPSSTMRRQVCGREGSPLQRGDTMWAHRAGASHCPLWRLSCLSHNSTR